MKTRLTMCMVVLLTVAVAATGCGGPLDGRTYKSEKVVGRDLVADTTVNLSFSGRHLTIQAGCNTITTSYQVSGGQLTATGTGSTTLMGCEPGLSEQDRWLQQWLSNGVKMTEDDDSLVLKGDGVSIEFQRS